MLKLDFTLDHILEDEFVRLSPLSLAHCDALEAVAADPAIWTYFMEADRAQGRLRSYVEKALEKREDQKEYPFVVFDKSTQQVAGSTRIYDLIDACSSAKIGHTWYGFAFHGTGLNKRCKYLLLDFAFEQIGALRVGFGASADNIKSIKALEYLGCQREGTIRDFLPHPSGAGRSDLALYGLLKKEWSEWARQELQDKIKARQG